MTVVAGISLFDGVMMAADCRITVKAKGRKDIHSDTLQKIIPITNRLAAGFCGDIETAARIFREMFRQLKYRKRRNPISLLSWLPRFFKSIYRQLSKRYNARPVHFMLASTSRDRFNVVKREKIVEIVQNMVKGTGKMIHNSIPDLFIQILRTSPAVEQVVLQGTTAGLLYTLKAPDFRLNRVDPLEFAAIGSGEKSLHEIRRSADWILGSGPGNELMESLGLQGAINDFVETSGLDDIGGMYTCVKVDRRGIVCIGTNSGFPGQRISMKYDNKSRKWRQHNEQTGKIIPLLLPWEINIRQLTINQTFNDHKDGMRLF